MCTGALSIPRSQVNFSVQSVEAAKECGMAVVVVAGRKPLYELKAADLVVKNLGELRLINLQQLFRNEDLVAAQVCHIPMLFSELMYCGGYKIETAP